MQPNDYNGNIGYGVKYFYLGDLWNSFYKWSACGVGTSVCIAPGETIEQYFVPYLSAMELYTNATNVPASNRYAASICIQQCFVYNWKLKERKVVAYMIVSETLDCYDDCNMVYDTRFNAYNQHGAIDWSHGYQTPPNMSKVGVESKGELVFKYFEPDSPYERVPFVDKVCGPIAQICLSIIRFFFLQIFALNHLNVT